ncbi:hypothetical protein HGRIS_008295 [Hohenbuehelia grisea]|uniref:PhoX domain-containing protein n=1 Tax=Hohenbuehelia grisea TaxID=104357 RepID=A0ABR3J7I9_9AGAR
MIPFSTQAAILLGVLAVVLPATFKVLSSPLLLLLLLPLIICFLILTFLGLSIYIGYRLDVQRNSAGRNSLHNAARPFAFSTPAAWQAVLTRSLWSYNSPHSSPPLCPESPVVSAALNDVLILIVRDFVLSWYKDISSSPSFPTAVSEVLNRSLAKVLDRAENIDLAAIVVKRILPKVTAHIEQFRQSEMALRGTGLERQLTQSEELDLLLASRYSAKGGIRLHSSIDNLSTTFTKQSEEAHLRQLIDRVLPLVLPEKEGKSRALKIVVREIVACSVLYPVMDMVADPDFWNRAIDQVAGAAIHQQKLITKVRNVLEAQSPRALTRAPSQAPATPRTETITIRTDPRQFESFLRSISRCSSLLDARRLRNDIVGEIRRTRILLGNHEKEDWINGEKTEDIVAFLDRLYTAKRKVEDRIVNLGGEEDPRMATLPESSPKSGLKLRDVLMNPSSLSYFMEFMDRRQRSLLVQFWLTVESFKNPLESVESGSEDDEDETLQDPSTSATMKEDINMINDLYFSMPTPHPALSSISPKHVEDIRAFARSAVTPSLATQRKVRKSVLLAQRQVERKMEQDFEEFERSELWFHVVGDTELNSRKSPPPDVLSHADSTSSALPGLSLAHGWGTHSTPQITSRHDSVAGVPMQRTHSSNSTNSLRISTGAAENSHRVTPPAIELLMSPPPDSSTSARSRTPLFADPDDEDHKAETAQIDRMEAIHAALTDIIALDQDQADHTSLRERQISGASATSDLLGRTNRSANRKGVFIDDEDDRDDEDAEGEEGQADTDDRPAAFHLAAPGDLQLSYEISRLGDKISNLQVQETMLDNLIKKAELTGDTQELRLLRRSKAAMNREARQLNFQKTQYEQQESANRLFSDGTRISILNSTTGEEEGKSVVRYLVTVQQLSQDGSFASGWVVARRYNEFLNMHNKLRERYVLVKGLDFPGKRLVPALSGSFVDTRRTALEKYLQNVVAIPAVCESDELRAFLSRDSPFMATEHPTRPKVVPGFSGTSIVRTMYKSVTDSIDDMFFGPSMLDVMIQRLTRHAAEFAGIVGSAVNDEDVVAQALNASGKNVSEAALMQLTGDLKPLEGETSTSSFSSPICDLLLAIFELNEQNNWLRRQAIVIILQQVLGGTIERKIRENVKSQLDEARILSFITLFRDQMWPDGKQRPPGKPRTAEEKLRTRDEANRKLSSLIPDLAANMIGRSNARRGARRIFAVLQNRRLNQHIAYTVVDEVFAALFPELATQTE